MLKCIPQVLCSFLAYVEKAYFSECTEWSQKLKLFVIATTEDTERVHPRLLRCFGDSVIFRNPSLLSRRRALGLLYSNLKSEIQIDLNAPCNGDTIRPSDLLDSLAEMSGGLPMSSLLHRWAERIADLISSGILIEDTSEDILAAVAKLSIKDNVNDRNNGTKMIMPLDGICGLETAKNEIRELVVSPRIHSKVHQLCN